ncbi:IclR family transcriptional regulator [Aestuariivirga sp. YIM B02566]|uniref:IclR family transcriptional regulator n=1 Tax=Taklimakanibacter albus TaxID=2800327 RepID=A0ACC5RBY4_9HYPH|nr:IclR family transcriptional regulator [Aestuariivirga sp. YIM B02566]MBK1870206.1 IclR family transcriptional regulator [Aestuariivirga sp. YIM B02566]
MISSLTRGLRILDLLVDQQRPWRLNELAQELDISKSGLHGLLATLVECGYVERLPGGFYQLGFKAWRIGNSFPTADLVHAASPIMERLVGETREGTILGVLNGFEVSYVHLVESSQIVRVHANIGDRISAHCTSTGLALLAFQDGAYVDRHIPAALAPSSSLTITEPENLKAELKRTRVRGYSINRGGWNADVGGIAAPVMGTRGPIAALCIALPLFRMNQSWVQRVAPLLQQAAAEIGQALLAQPDQQQAAR